MRRVSIYVATVGSYLPPLLKFCTLCYILLLIVSLPPDILSEGICDITCVIFLRCPNRELFCREPGFELTLLVDIGAYPGTGILVVNF